MNYLKVLADWNFWDDNQIDTGVNRKKYLLSLGRLMKMPEIISVLGVRRCGKSTILLQIIREIHSKKKVPYENCLYINFEDPRLGNDLQASHLFAILDEYRKTFKPKGRVYLFLDEVQNVGSWEKFCRTIYDQKEDIKILLTGSTSETFNSDLSKLLSGRIINFNVSPLDFAEFLDFKKADQSLSPANKLFDEYLQFGGFPRVVLEPNETNKLSLLISYYETIIEKDVILKNDIKNKAELKNLTRFVLSNIGNQISSYALEKTLKISNENIGRYLNFLEESFIISRIPLFSYSVKKQIYNPDKVFVVDTGLSKVAGFSFSENRGRLLENLVYQKLCQADSQVYYWKNKTEIDFLIFAGGKVEQLINVTQTVDDPEVRQREIGSLTMAKKEFPDAKEMLLSLYNQSRQEDGRVGSLIDFLLKETGQYVSRSN
ncbi:MAG: ATP-binding protein [Patescibacteria group bacterium]